MTRMRVLDWLLIVWMGAPWVLAPAAHGCLGDCDGDRRVAINELVVGVNIALDRSALGSCDRFDDGSGRVSVDVLVRAVRNSLAGCPTEPTRTATPSATPETPGVDLRPDSAFTFVPPDPRGCVGDFSEIADPVTRFCVANAGTLAAGAFDVRMSGDLGEEVFRVAALPGSGLECYERAFVGSDLMVTVDSSDEVAERDETNNDAFFEAPPPTLTPPPLCTATASPVYTPTATEEPATHTPTAFPPSPTATPTASPDSTLGATSSPTPDPSSSAEVEALVASVLNQLDDLAGVATGAGGLTGLGSLSGLTIPLPCLNGGTQALGCSDEASGALVTFEYSQCITELEGERIVLNGVMTFATSGSCALDPFGAGASATLRFDGLVETTDLASGESFSVDFDLTMIFTAEESGVLRFSVSGDVEASCVPGVTTIETLEDVVIDGVADCPSAGRFRLTRSGVSQEVAYTNLGGVEIDVDGDGVADLVLPICNDPALEECFTL